MDNNILPTDDKIQSARLKDASSDSIRAGPLGNITTTALARPLTDEDIRQIIDQIVPRTECRCRVENHLCISAAFGVLLAGFLVLAVLLMALNPPLTGGDYSFTAHSLRFAGVRQEIVNTGFASVLAATVLGGVLIAILGFFSKARMSKTRIPIHGHMQREMQCRYAMAFGMVGAVLVGFPAAMASLALARGIFMGLFILAACGVGFLGGWAAGEVAFLAGRMAKRLMDRTL